MGIQGPLTAQALGRSPYDEVVQGEGEDNPNAPAQEYDSRGRPINPESKRINKDIIRSHNEVMLVVGVAEPENPHSSKELESKRLHDNYETGLGVRLIWATKRCVEMIGVFGVNGMRQRVLVYKEFSHTPCWDLYQSWRENYSFTRHVLPGAPSSLLANYIERRFMSHWFVPFEAMTLMQRSIDCGWIFLKLHLELFAAYQRLGLIQGTQILPSWKYFIPFTDQSPIPPPPSIEDLSPGSLMHWGTLVLAGAAPMILFTAAKQIFKRVQPNVWQQVLSRLPSPIHRGRGIGPLPPEEPAEPLPIPSPPPEPEVQIQEEPAQIEPEVEESSNLTPDGSPPPPLQPDLGRRQSVYEDYGTDEEDHEVSSRTLISFDVEATEATEVPQGLWSAELRPSIGPESRSAQPVAYLSTMLSRFPSLMAAKLLTDSVVRLCMAPAEAMALRLAAGAFCMRNGLPISHIQSLSLFPGANWTWMVNFLGVELIHLALCGEVWSGMTLVSSAMHKSEKDWEALDDADQKAFGDWLGPFFSLEPLF